MSSWPTKELREICNFQNGLWKGKQPPFVKIPVLRNTNFRNDGALDFSNVAKIEVEKRQLDSRRLEKGDILLERSGGGPIQPVGRVAFFDRSDLFGFSNFVTRIRVEKKHKLTPFFFGNFYITFMFLETLNICKNEQLG